MTKPLLIACAALLVACVGLAFWVQALKGQIREHEHRAEVAQAQAIGLEAANQALGEQASKTFADYEALLCRYDSLTNAHNAIPNVPIPRPIGGAAIRQSMLRAARTR